MYALRIFLQRRRKLLTRLGALLVLGVGGMLAVLPRADAHGAGAASTDPGSLLLSPQPMWGERFGTFYAPEHR